MISKYPVITLCGSTRSEIEYAKAKGKTIMYMEEELYEAPSTTVTKVEMDSGILFESNVGVGMLSEH